MNSPFGQVGRVPHILWIWLIASAVGYGKKGWTSYRQKRLAEKAEDWPEQSATVVWAQSIAERHGNEGPKLFTGRLTYSYQGDELEVGEYRVSFHMEAEADEWARKLRNTRIRIRVNPANKKESVWITDEVKRSKEHAEHSVMTDIAASEPLTGALELWRLATLLVVTLAGPVAVWMHLTAIYCLATGRASGLAPHQGLFFGLYGLLFVCSFSCAALVKRRFPMTGDATGYAHLSPEARTAIKIAGAYGTVCFCILWVWNASHPGRPGDPWLAEFSAGWIPGYLGAWLICRRLGADEDLGAHLASRTAKM